MTSTVRDYCLVYLKNVDFYAEVDGYTYWAYRISPTEVQLASNERGELIEDGKIINDPMIVSDRIPRTIKHKSFYQFVPDVAPKKLLAKNFVAKNRLTLAQSSRTALGTGIYGTYIHNERDLQNYTTSPNQTIYKVTCERPYIVQDKEHGESITVASLHLNRYIDFLLENLSGNPPSDNSTKNNNPAFVNVKIKLNNLKNKANQDLRRDDAFMLKNITTLWSIALERTYDDLPLTLDFVEAMIVDVVNRYIYDYQNSTFTIGEEDVVVMPINYIMGYLGYDGLMAEDSFNNGWTRGCIKYDFSEAENFEWNAASY